MELIDVAWRLFAAGQRKGLLAATVLAAWAALASPDTASAQTTYYAVGDGTPNVFTTTIPVTASIGGVCGFASAPSGSYDAGQIDATSWTHDFPFTLLCTVPSRVAVVSQNGGLKTPLPTAVAGYTNVAPYAVTLNLDGDTTTISQGCQAETLRRRHRRPVRSADPRRARTGCGSTTVRWPSPTRTSA